MCGLVFSISGRPVKDFVLSAHDRQSHRGPDGEGFYFQENSGIFVGMAHERLSIVDLSELGLQPMLSASGRYRILFNGEIYNYKELASEHRLGSLRSGSDTEVAIELIELLGMTEACKKFNGMWAMVVQDVINNKFFISRDRFGKKPLYVRQDAQGTHLSSEMSSLLLLPQFEARPDSVVASRFLAQSLQNIDNRSWIEGVTSFPPATVGEIDGFEPWKGVVNTKSYWLPGFEDVASGSSDRERIDVLRSLVSDAIRLRLNADVPVGIALSGGLDSSILAAEASKFAKIGGNLAMLFSAVNPGSKEDESAYVDIMARHLGSTVDKFVLDPLEGDGLLSLLKKCISHADGPVSSFSNVLFYKLMESARSSGIKVVLTGQGADEVFCGYRKYPILEIKRRLRSLRVGSAIGLAKGFILNGTLLPEFNLREAKRYLGSSNQSILGESSINSLKLEPLGQIDTLAGRQWEDIDKYSVPYLCHYEDRMSMALSREVRSPFLDYRVVDMGLRMPTRLKLSNGWTKYSLRKAFENAVPPSISWRKDKKGFVNPQDDWLRGPLRTVVRDTMSSPDSLVYRFGLVNRVGYLERFDAYCSGRGHVWFRDVFAPFSLELWLQTVFGNGRR